MSVPRSWNNVTEQGGFIQQMTIAEPTATDGRFKASAILLCLSWFVVLYNVRHILYYYKPRKYGPFSFITSLIQYLPARFFLNIMLVAIYLAYLVASTWKFNISLMKYDGPASWAFSFGYTPCLLIIIIFNIWGFLEENEDKQLMKQRIERGLVADAEIGIVKKPSWWSKARGDSHLDNLQRLRVHVADYDNDAPKSAKEELEMKGMSNAVINTPLSSIGAREYPQTDDRMAILADPGPVGNHRQSARNLAQHTVDRAPSNNSLASALTGNTLTDENLQARRQVTRSMLDV
jgi:hypothetical protein